VEFAVKVSIHTILRTKKRITVDGSTGEEWLPLTRKIKKEYSEFHEKITASTDRVAEKVV
jgi:hypothetical protein